MAGDWIKLRLDLRTDPAVFKLASITKLDRFSIVGRLAEFWGWVDKHAVDGVVDGATSTVVDDVVSFDGFADALVAVDWLRLHENSIEIPKHERHNSESAKERGLKNARQARWRANKDAIPLNVDAPPSTKASTREEKRREDIEPKGSVASATKIPTCPTSSIIDLYHENLPELPSVRLATESRKKAISKFWNFALTSEKPDGTRRATTPDEALQWAGDYFKRARDNDFLMSRGAKSAGHDNWQCDIDFLMTEKGMKHVIEKTKETA